MAIIFVSGIHAVGKTTFCSQVSQQLRLPHYSCSDLIKANSSYIEQQKRLNEIDKNQDVLSQAIKNQTNDPHFILDGHFCLVDKSNSIKTICESTFITMHPSLIINIIADPKIVVDRLIKRGDKSFSIDFIKNFMDAETARANYIASLIDIPIYTQATIEDTSQAINTVKKHLSE